MRKWNSCLWLTYFLLPFIYFIFLLVDRSQLPQIHLFNLIRVSGLSVFQAIVSSLCIMIVGGLLTYGLMAVKDISRYKVFLILPAMTPSLFIMTSCMGWAQLSGFELRPGLFAVVLIHTLINAGFAGLLLHELILSRMGSQWQLARIEGAGRWQLFKASFSSLKTEILIISAGFFLFCFTSFSVPLVLGGSFAKTLEVLAYEQLVLNADLSGAFLVALAQMIIYSSLFIMVRQSGNLFLSAKQFDFKDYGFRGLAFLLTALIIALAYSGLVWELPQGMSELLENKNAMELLQYLLGRSLFYSLLSGLLSLILASFMLFNIGNPFMHKLMVAFGAISASLLGISLYVWNIGIQWKLLYAYSILYFPIAYRFYGPAVFSKLYGQNQILQTLGGSRWQNFIHILLPQALPSFFRLSGLVAVWTLGDFALTGVITGETETLAVFTKTILSSYRTEVASVLCVFLLFLCILIYLLFEGLSYVSRKKLFVEH